MVDVEASTLVDVAACRVSMVIVKAGAFVDITVGIELGQAGRRVNPVGPADNMTASVEAGLLEHAGQVGAQPGIVGQQRARHHHLARRRMHEAVVGPAARCFERHACWP